MRRAINDRPYGLRLRQFAKLLFIIEKGLSRNDLTLIHILDIKEA